MTIPRQGRPEKIRNTHAPQAAGVILGVVLAILARIGVSLTGIELSLLTQAITLLVPIVGAWITGYATEHFTYSRKTVDRLVSSGETVVKGPQDMLDE